MAEQHRREIWARLCLSYGIVSHLLWMAALDGHQHVGVCSACQQPMRPERPEQRGRRMHYPAVCTGCGREVEGVGPRPEKPDKPKKGGG